MPPSWEHSIDTTAQSTLWGKNLIWSWREGLHDQEAGVVASQLNWETDLALEKECPLAFIYSSEWSPMEFWRQTGGQS